MGVAGGDHRGRSALRSHTLSPMVWRDPTIIGLGGVVAVVLTLGVGLWFVRDATLGDLALIEMDTRRVFSSSPPLTGAYSRYGWRHPGPAVFGVLALPYRVFGANASALATAALLLNAVSMVATILLARRRGAAAGVAVTSVLLLLVHGMGSDGIGYAWNVSVTLVPLVLVVVACWSSLRGDPWGLPGMLLGYIFVAESHVGNGVAVTPVFALSVCALLTSPGGRRMLRGSRRLLIGSGAVAALAILPIAIDALRDPPGNVGRMLRWSLQHDEPGLPWSDTLRLLGRTSSLSFPYEPEQPRFVLEATTGSAGVLPGLLVGVLGALAFAAWRTRHTEEATLCGLMLVWWAAALVAVRSIAAPPWYWLVEWLQPLGWLTLGAIALTAWRLWSAPAGSWARPAATSMLLALTALAVAGQIRTVSDWRSRELVAAIPVDTLATAAAATALPGGVSFELDGLWFSGEPMLAGVVNELDRRGVRVCIESGLEYKFPPGFGCSAAGTARLVLRTELATQQAPSGTEALVVADALDPATRARADATRDRIIAILQSGGGHELVPVVDTMLVADELLDRPSPAIAELASEIRWLDGINSAPHTRYALYQRVEPEAGT